MNAPDLLVRHNGRAVQTVNYGICRGNTTKTFQLVNTGTSALQLYAMSSDPTFYTLSQQMFNIAPGESATIDVTFNFNAEALGAHQAALVLTPTNCQISHADDLPVGLYHLRKCLVGRLRARVCRRGR
jgi:hypothetical protein